MELERLRHWAGGALATLALFTLASEVSAHNVRLSSKATTRIQTRGTTQFGVSRVSSPQLSLMQRVANFRLLMPFALDAQSSNELLPGDLLAQTSSKDAKKDKDKDQDKDESKGKSKKGKKKASPTKSKKKKKK